MGEQLTVEDLFHKSWFRPLGLNTLFFVLYAPIGLLLLIIRAFIAVQFFILISLLPPSEFRSKCLRVMSAVLGMTISTDGKMDPQARVFVANHITQFDHIAINFVTNALCPTKEIYHPLIWKLLSLGYLPGDGVTLTSDDISSSEPWIIFPEGTSTNGESGVLAFNSATIPQGVTVQPVALQVSRVFLNSSSISGSLAHEVFVALFVPNTHFTLQFLASEIADSEGTWTAKTQLSIASSLNLTATKYLPSDKLEYVKRTFRRPPNLATMARAVQQQLAPQIYSPERILAALQSLGTVEGAVESLRSTGGSSESSVLPPSTFSKSSTQRMMSFQERKRLMIALARQKYIEKHKLKIDSSTA